MLFFATCIQCICTTRGPVLWGQDVCSKDESYGNTDAVQGPTLWVMCKGPINPMGICCMYKGPILWGHDACHKGSILWDSACSYTSLCTVSSGSVSCTRTSYMRTQYAQRIVVKWNTSTEHTCNNTQIIVST